MESPTVYARAQRFFLSSSSFGSWKSLFLKNIDSCVDSDPLGYPIKKYLPAMPRECSMPSLTFLENPTQRLATYWSHGGWLAWWITKR
jgi:hypothetical protein